MPRRHWGAVTERERSMSSNPTGATPLRVAIIGSGPSGFYAAEALLKQSEGPVEVDVFDRLPTPYGLVRGGVAPDHQKIKEVTKAYERVARDPRFRFYGNVTFGTDITRADLKARYHATIYAVGAQTDRHLGIPGEDLPGSHAATEFVAWYNAHPDYQGCQFDLSGKRAVVIGNGNVAMDVARILASSVEELSHTDMGDRALAALRESQINEIIMLGRRGPAQAAFTNKELKEFGELKNCDVIVDPVEGRPDAVSAAWLAANHDPEAEKNLATLAAFIERPPASRPRRIVMRFLASPVALIGTEKVEAIRIVRNELKPAADGSLRASPTNITEEFPVDLVFRSIGYKGVPLPGVPFDTKAAVIPNDHGRVLVEAGGVRSTGEYCTGWIKRGPSGVIGDNRKDSSETVRSLLEDVPILPAPDAALGTRDSLESLLAERGIAYVTFQDWLALDKAETERGAAEGRPRVKVDNVDEMLRVIRAARAEATAQ